jgi:hypothetical protein
MQAPPRAFYKPTWMPHSTVLWQWMGRDTVATKVARRWAFNMVASPATGSLVSPCSRPAVRTVLLAAMKNPRSAKSHSGMLMGCKTVANMIKGKSPEEIRKTFNIQNDPV